MRRLLRKLLLTRQLLRHRSPLKLLNLLRTLMCLRYPQLMLRLLKTSNLRRPLTSPQVQKKL